MRKSTKTSAVLTELLHISNNREYSEIITKLYRVNALFNISAFLPSWHTFFSIFDITETNNN